MDRLSFEARARSESAPVEAGFSIALMGQIDASYDMDSSPTIHHLTVNGTYLLGVGMSMEYGQPDSARLFLQVYGPFYEDVFVGIRLAPLRWLNLTAGWRWLGGEITYNKREWNWEASGMCFLLDIAIPLIPRR